MSQNDIGFTIIKGNYYCSWCEAAENHIKEKGYKVEMRELGPDSLLVEAKKARMCTVPIIYHGTKLVGGYHKLRHFMDTLDKAA